MKSRAPVNNAGGVAGNVVPVVAPIAVQVRHDDDMQVVDKVRRPVDLDVGAKKPRHGQQ